MVVRIPASPAPRVVMRIWSRKSQRSRPENPKPLKMLKPTAPSPKTPNHEALPSAQAARDPSACVLPPPSTGRAGTRCCRGSPAFALDLCLGGEVFSCRGRFPYRLPKGNASWLPLPLTGPDCLDSTALSKRRAASRNYKHPTWWPQQARLGRSDQFFLSGSFCGLLLSHTCADVTSASRCNIAALIVLQVRWSCR